MNNKKILIWMSESQLKPVGGPSGYLYNIKQFIDSNKTINNIDFLPPTNNEVSVRNNIISFFIKNILFLNFWSLKSFLLKKNKLPSKVDLSMYDIIHFHDTISLFKARDSIDKFSGQVLLTSHSPEPLHKELINNNYAIFKNRQKKALLNILNFIDKFSFLRADYIMFPCEEAKEPYLDWPFFNNIINIKNEKFIYCPTGSSEVKVISSKKDIRKKFNIKSDGFVISYVGRHNSIKGFDNLKKIGKEILNKFPHVYFLIAGKEAPMKGLDHSRWVEVGYTKDPHSLINASDLFILPNKQTFFDLILLEVLCIGTKILATHTGGNKFFKKFNKINMEFFNNEEDAINKVSLLINQKSNVDLNINKEVFNKNFTNSVFISNYNKILNNLN